MSEFDDFVSGFVAPAAMESFGETQSVLITLADNASFKVDAIIERSRGSGGGEFGEETKIEVSAVHVLREVLTAKGLTILPAKAKFVVDGRTWSIRISESEWGQVWVKFGLELEVLVREWQGRRNAAV